MPRGHHNGRENQSPTDAEFWRIIKANVTGGDIKRAGSAIAGDVALDYARDLATFDAELASVLTQIGENP